MPLNCRRHEVYCLETMRVFAPAQMEVYGYRAVLLRSSLYFSHL